MVGEFQLLNCVHPSSRASPRYWSSWSNLSVNFNQQNYSLDPLGPPLVQAGDTDSFIKDSVINFPAMYSLKTAANYMMCKSQNPKDWCRSRVPVLLVLSETPQSLTVWMAETSQTKMQKSNWWTLGYKSLNESMLICLHQVPFKGKNHSDITFSCYITISVFFSIFIDVRNFKILEVFSLHHQKLQFDISLEYFESKEEPLNM